MPDVTAIVGTPTPTPKRPRLYAKLVPQDGRWVIYGEGISHRASETPTKPFGLPHVPFVIPGEAELSENGKPAMTDRESRCIVCGGRLAKDNFCGKCGVRTRPAASMSPREERLVEAASIAVKYLDALDKGQVFRPDEPTSVWGHLRSALADYDDGSEHPTRPEVRAE